MGRATPAVVLPLNIAPLLAAAATVAAGRPVVGLRAVRSLRWVPAAIPAGAEVTVTERRPGHVDVVAPGYGRGVVLLGAPGRGWSGVAGEPAASGGEGAALDVHAHDGRGLHGTVRADDGPALVEVAARALAWWAEATDDTVVAVPARIEAMDLTGPTPAPGERLGCVARVVDAGDAADADVRGSVELMSDGAVRARLDGVVVHRLPLPEALRPALRAPERTPLAERREGYCLMRGPWPSSAVRDVVMHLYLHPSEWERYDALTPNAQQGWALGRVAVKDAVRRCLWEHGAGPIHPQTVRVENDADGRPWARGPDGVVRPVSVAHRHSLAVASVAVEGVDAGIDVELIEPRAESFVRVSMTDGELALRRDQAVDEWVTRLWTIKEAVAKAAGTGLQGRPRAFVVEEVDGDWARIGERWVHTTREEEFVVSTVRLR
jgi:phosphopantetheinyl transferase (holo-ACP synthase)